MTGGSFLRFSMLVCSICAVSRLAVSASSEIRKPAVGAAASTTAVNRCSSASRESGQRTSVTLTSRMSAVPATRSVSMADVNQNAPKIGSSPPFNSSAMAARPLSVLPSSASGCGWYTTMVPSSALISCGQSSACVVAGQDTAARDRERHIERMYCRGFRCISWLPSGLRLCSTSPPSSRGLPSHEIEVPDRIRARVRRLTAGGR